MTKFTKNFVMIFISMVMLATTLEAKDRKFAQIFTECGLGGKLGREVGGSNGKMVAVMSNITWDLGTTAVSSNMSSDENCASHEAKTAAFIYKGYENIEQDLSNGNGLYIQALAKISNQNEKDFILNARIKFSKMIASNNYTLLTKYQKAQKLYNIVY
jgi:hypothetical protein